MRKVVFLTNFIPPYRLPVLRAISARLDSFQVWISTPMEKNRGWDVDFGDLHVEVQKNLTFNGWWRHPSGFSEPNSIHFPYDTVKRLRRWEPNVVISVEMGWRTFQAAIYRCLNGEARLVVWADVSCVTEEGRNFVRRLLRTWILRVADFVIVNGESGGKYVRKLGVPRSRIARIPYTTELDAFLALPVTRNRESAHRLLYCGQLVERKGLLEFLSVLQKWVEQHPDRNIEFTILGEGVLKQRLQKFRTSPNLRITFQPHTSYKSLPDYYGAAGIFVLPTRADTWGLVVNEAMASGLPVLGSTNSQAVEELVEQDKTGWRFCPDRFEDTYAAVDRALTTSVAELNAMRTASRNTAATITPASVAEKVLEVIDAASAPRRKRLALLTNIVAPYKRPIYNSLAEVMDTAVFVSGTEDNRRHWDSAVLEDRFETRRCWGLSLRWKQKRGNVTYDVHYLHVTFGYWQRLMGYRPDVIVSNEMGVRTVVALLYGAAARIPVWVWWGGTRHTESGRGPVRRFLRKLLSRSVQHWISYGNTSTDYLCSIGVARERILQVQNSVDHRVFAHQAILAKEVIPFPRLLYVGQMLARKGVDFLLESAARLQARGLRFSLLLVGGGPEESRLREKARRLQIANIEFLRNLPPERMAAVYHSCNCLILPTLEEVWGLVVNEAIWAGIPVICSRLAGCAEELLPPPNVFDPTDIADFDRALKNAVEGNVALADQRTLKTYDQVADAIIADISRVLDPQTTSSPRCAA